MGRHLSDLPRVANVMRRCSAISALLAAVLCAGGRWAYADDAQPPPVLPWAVNFERPLRDSLAPLLRSHAPRILRLSEDEVRVLEEMLQAHAVKWKEFEARARADKQALDDELAQARQNDPGSLMDVQLRRESALAPLADAQASLEATLLEEVRARFADAYPADWWTLRYTLDRARYRNLNGGLATNAPDILVLANRAMAVHPEAVRDTESLRALIGSYCERAVKATATMRDAETDFARTFFRSTASAMRRSGADVPANGVRRPNDAATRRTFERMERRARAAQEQARLNLATYKAIEGILDEPARTDFQKGFWRPVAAASGVTWWPIELDQFQAAIADHIPEEHGATVRALFTDAWNSALMRIIALDRRMRSQVGESVEVSSRSFEEMQELARAADEQECRMMNELCESVMKLVPAERHAEIRKPVLKPARRAPPPGG